VLESIVILQPRVLESVIICLIKLLESTDTFKLVMPLPSPVKIAAFTVSE
jgi:hypothetical protein